jgi:SAM-dependent methyltransferase
VTAGPLAVGNTAKLYCLQLIDRAAAEAGDGDYRILDLGCGTGANFVELLRRRPNVTYVGVEPSRAAAEEARRLLPGAEIVNEPAYGVRVEPAHAVVSFSALEHVVDRQRYFEAVRANLRPDGLVYLNYDSGHFVADADLRERVKALGSAGLRVVEAKSFNTDLKRLYPFVPAESRATFMERWLDFELELNELGIEYRDELAPIFRTRNFLLEP